LFAIPYELEVRQSLVQVDQPSQRGEHAIRDLGTGGRDGPSFAFDFRQFLLQSSGVNLVGALDYEPMIRVA
jgi:hypothetical protein